MDPLAALMARGFGIQSRLDAKSGAHLFVQFWRSDALKGHLVHGFCS
jgi:hypothetical protein